MTYRSSTPPLTADELAQALCTQADPEAWFPETDGNAAPAQAVCHTCPIIARCLDLALSMPASLDGVWGGTTPNQRRALRRHRAAATTVRTEAA